MANAYHYANNDPINELDPSGESSGKSPFPDGDSRFGHGSPDVPGPNSASSPSIADDIKGFLRNAGDFVTQPSSVGVCGTAVEEAGIAGRADLCVLDDGGDFWGLTTGVVGIGTLSAGLTAGYLLSNAQTAPDLQGTAVCVVFSVAIVGIPALAGVDGAVEVCAATTTAIPTSLDDLTLRRHALPRDGCERGSARRAPCLRGDDDSPPARLSAVLERERSPEVHYVASVVRARFRP